MSDPQPGRTRPTPPPSQTKGWVIGRVMGAPIIITPSWLLATVLLTVLFAPSVQRMAPGMGTEVYLVSLAFVLLLFISVFLHELAHAFVAKSRGNQVTELALTLWGGHTAYTGASGKALDGLLIAVAGPATNLALALLGWVTFQTQHVMTIPVLLLYAAAVSNAFVGFFNLLPGLPLDGGQILESIVWAVTGSRTKGTIAAGWVGRIVAVGVVLWAFVPYATAGQKPDLVTVVWALFIASFLWQGATSAIRVGHARAAVAGLSVQSMMGPAVTVRFDASVADAGAAVGARGGAHVLAIVVNDVGRPIAFVDPAAAVQVPPDDARRTPVMAVAVALAGDGIDVRLSGQPMLAALADIGPESPPYVAVLDGVHVVGALEVKQVINALQNARR